MEITDILVGERRVIIELADRTDIEYPTDENGRIVESKDNIPEQIQQELLRREIKIAPEFPQEIKLYAHDERAYTAEEIANKLQISENAPVLEDVAGIPYEIPFTVVVEDDTTWKVTHAFGRKLEEPYYY